MTQWIKYIGELVWRICRYPRALAPGSREENFIFRTYGVVVLAVWLFVALVLMFRGGDVVARFVVSALAYDGPEQPVVVVLMYAILAVVGLVLLVLSTVVVASVVGTALAMATGYLEARDLWRVFREWRQQVAAVRVSEQKSTLAADESLTVDKNRL